MKIQFLTLTKTLKSCKFISLDKELRIIVFMARKQDKTKLAISRNHKRRSKSSFLSLSQFAKYEQKLVRKICTERFEFSWKRKQFQMNSSTYPLELESVRAPQA